jgi:hypothetical protein
MRKKYIAHAAAIRLILAAAFRAACSGKNGGGTDAEADSHSLWIDGDLKLDGNSSIPVSQESFTRIILSGWSSILRDYTGDFHIDDIVVADGFVGCS